MGRGVSINERTMTTEACSQILKECYGIFKKRGYKRGEALICQINQAFKQEDHNCVGCNLSDASEKVLRYLKRYRSLTEPDQDVEGYLLLLYLFGDRMETLRSIMGVPDRYWHKHFGVLSRVKRLANFIKHPGAFILTHHPQYLFEGMEPDFKPSVVIDEAFIKLYYSNADKDRKRELTSKLRNKMDVVVKWPDLIALTDAFCTAYEKFTLLILNNEVYREILEDEATVVSYFEREGESQLPEQVA